MNVTTIHKAFELQIAGTYPLIELEIIVSDKQVKLLGRKTLIVMLGIPSVTILSKQSTPAKRMLCDKAESGFSAAVSSLLENGGCFYTEQNPGWTLPAYTWTKA